MALLNSTVEDTVIHMNEHIQESTRLPCLSSSSETVIYEIVSKVNITKSLKNQLFAYDILIPILGTVIVLANLVVVVSSGLIVKRRLQQSKCTYLLLGNMALADMATGLAITIGSIYPKTNRNHSMCAIHMGLIVTSILASVYSIGLIAVDRFIYIIYGLQYHRWMFPTRVRCLIVLTWILGASIGFLPLMGWYGNTHNGKICWFIMLAPPELVITTTIIGIIPGILVLILYSIIVATAIKKVVQLRALSKATKGDDTEGIVRLRMFRGSQSISVTSESTSEETDIKTKPSTDTIANNQMQCERKMDNLRKWKAIKVVLFTTGCFFSTWVPYFIACTVYVTCDFFETPQKCQNLKFAIASPFAILGYLNSLMNPVIYAWWHKGFRNTTKQMYKKRKRIKLQTISDAIFTKMKRSNNSNGNQSATAKCETVSITAF